MDSSTLEKWKWVAFYFFKNVVLVHLVTEMIFEVFSRVWHCISRGFISEGYLVPHESLLFILS